MGGDHLGQGEGSRRAHRALDDPYSAAVAHDRVALHLMGPRGRLLNFPGRKLVPASIDDIRAERRRDRSVARKARTGNGYVGVYPHESYGRKLRWMTQMWIGGRLVAVGTWATERAAALAYDRASLHIKDRAVNLPTVAARLGPATVKELRAAAALVNKAKKSSRFRGVHWHREARKWRANIRIDDVLIHLGLFIDEEEAARVYDRAARKAWGRAAPVNFP